MAVGIRYELFPLNKNMLHKNRIVKITQDNKCNI